MKPTTRLSTYLHSCYNRCCLNAVVPQFDGVKYETQEVLRKPATNLIRASECEIGNIKVVKQKY